MINKEKWKELLQYGFWGVLTTGINLLLFVIFEYFGIYYIYANTVSYYIACCVNFYVNKKFVFNNSDNIHIFVQLIKFLVMRTVSIVFDNILFYFLVDICCFNIYISRISLTFGIILLTFVVNKKYIFK